MDGCLNQIQSPNLSRLLCCKCILTSRQPNATEICSGKDVTELCYQKSAERESQNNYSEDEIYNLFCSQTYCTSKAYSFIPVSTSTSTKLLLFHILEKQQGLELLLINSFKTLILASVGLSFLFHWPICIPFLSPGFLLKKQKGVRAEQCNSWTILSIHALYSPAPEHILLCLYMVPLHLFLDTNFVNRSQICGLRFSFNHKIMSQV